MIESIEINDVVESILQEPPFVLPSRVLWIERDTDFVLLISLQNPPKQPWSYSWTTLLSQVREGKLRHTTVIEPEFMRVIESEISQKDRDIRNASWELIEPLINTSPPGLIFCLEAMGKMVAERARAIAEESKTTPDRKRLYRALYRYWLFGSVPNALLPNYIACGAQGKERQFLNGKKSGRPPKDNGVFRKVIAKNLSEEDKEAIRIGYALYKENKVESIKQAYTRTISKFYRANHVVPGFSEDEIILRPLEELPTPTQFEYWGQKAFDDMTVMRSRKGERKWQKDLRPIVGRSNQGLFGPCHLFEIDATIADIYLVSRYNRNWIIGRPVVYVVVDVFSRMIVGVYVGLEGPSWQGARQALLNAFSDKVAFCAAHGIPISQQDWPCFHLPQEICGDRAEMLGKAAEGLGTGLSINLAFPPPYRPDWKAMVESRFRLLNQLTQVHWTPGGVAERIKERGQRDYRLDATLNLQEFTRIIINSVLHYNRFSQQTDWLNEEMINQDIASSPISIWNWGINLGLGRPNIQSGDLVRLHLMPKSKASVHAGGIYFFGMYYVAEDGSDNMRYARARTKGRETIDVWHDPTKPECIWIRNEDKSLKRCILRKSEERYRDYRLEEIRDMLEMIKSTSPEHKYAELSSLVRLDEDIQSTINQAEAEKEQCEKPKSKAAQLSNIRGNRTIERLTERVLADNAPAVSVKDSALSNDTKNLYSASLPQQSTDIHTVTEIFGSRGDEVINILSKLRKK